MSYILEGGKTYLEKNSISDSTMYIVKGSIRPKVSNIAKLFYKNENIYALK